MFDEDPHKNYSNMHYSNGGKYFGQNSLFFPHLFLISSSFFSAKQQKTFYIFLVLRFRILAYSAKIFTLVRTIRIVSPFPPSGLPLVTITKKNSPLYLLSEEVISNLVGHLIVAREWWIGPFFIDIVSNVIGIVNDVFTMHQYWYFDGNPQTH